MNQDEWLARRDAAIDAAFSATCAEACLASLHQAGIYSVLARAAQVSEGAGADV